MAARRMLSGRAASPSVSRSTVVAATPARRQFSLWVLGAQNPGNLPAQFRDILADGLPDDCPVNPEIGVRQGVSERNGLLPGNFGMAVSKSGGQPGGSLPDDGQPAQDHILSVFVCGQGREIDARQTRGNAVGCFEDVAQEQLIMPPRRAATRRESRTGSPSSERPWEPDRHGVPVRAPVHH